MRTSSFEIEGSGGLPIRGDVRLPDAAAEAPLPVVVLVHGFKGFRRWGFWGAISEALVDAGLGVVGFDMSHNGVGPGGLDFDEEALFEANTWGREEEDLEAVLTALRRRDLPGAGELDPTRLGLLGHSRGGGLVIVHAANDPAVRATVAMAPVASLFRLDEDTLAKGRQAGFIPIVNTRTGQILRLGADALAEIETRPELDDIPANHAARLGTPLLVCHGESDPAVDPEDGRRLAAAAPEGRFEPFPGADHVLGCCHPWGGSNPDFERFLGLATGFLAARL